MLLYDSMLSASQIALDQVHNLVKPPKPCKLYLMSSSILAWASRSKGSAVRSLIRSCSLRALSCCCSTSTLVKRSAEKQRTSLDSMSLFPLSDTLQKHNSYLSSTSGFSETLYTLDNSLLTSPFHFSEMLCYYKRSTLFYVLVRLLWNTLQKHRLKSRKTTNLVSCTKDNSLFDVLVSWHL